MPINAGDEGIGSTVHEKYKARLGFLYYELVVGKRKRRERSQSEDNRRSWILRSNIGLFLFGKQAAFMSGVWWGNFLCCYTQRVLLCLYDSVVFDHGHRRVLEINRTIWKGVWNPAVSLSIQTKIKWIISTAVWIESFIMQQDIKLEGHLWCIRK